MVGGHASLSTEAASAAAAAAAAGSGARRPRAGASVGTVIAGAASGSDSGIAAQGKRVLWSPAAVAAVAVEETADASGSSGSSGGQGKHAMVWMYSQGAVSHEAAPKPEGGSVPGPGAAVRVVVTLELPGPEGLRTARERKRGGSGRAVGLRAGLRWAGRGRARRFRVVG